MLPLLLSICGWWCAFFSTVPKIWAVGKHMTMYSYEIYHTLLSLVLLAIITSHLRNWPANLLLFYLFIVAYYIESVSPVETSIFIYIMFSHPSVILLCKGTAAGFGLQPMKRNLNSQPPSLCLVSHALISSSLPYGPSSRVGRLYFF